MLAQFAPANGTIFGVPFDDLNADQLRRTMTLMREMRDTEREVGDMHKAFLASVRNHSMEDDGGK